MQVHYLSTYAYTKYCLHFVYDSLYQHIVIHKLSSRFVQIKAVAELYMIPVHYSLKVLNTIRANTKACNERKLYCSWVIECSQPCAYILMFVPLVRVYKILNWFILNTDKQACLLNTYYIYDYTREYFFWGYISSVNDMRVFCYKYGDSKN